jgi:hypothetical protein
MKPALLEKIRIALRVRLDRLAKAAYDAHAAATDPGVPEHPCEAVVTFVAAFIERNPEYADLVNHQHPS